MLGEIMENEAAKKDPRSGPWRLKKRKKEEKLG